MSAAILSAVDRAAFATALVVRLRRHGVATGPAGAAALVRALALPGALSAQRLYWSARVALVHERADLAAFDAVFAGVLESSDHADVHIPPPPRQRGAGAAPDGGDGDAPASGLPWVTLPRQVGALYADGDSDLTLPEPLPTDLAARAEVPFGELTAGELHRLGSWLERAARRWPTRRTRRRVIGDRGPAVALRETLRLARTTGGEPVRLRRARAARRPRRVVLLCDVSRSMQAQSVAYLHLMRALARSRHGEVFAFSTSLTRLTVTLREGSPAEAVRLAGEQVDDRFGGTRIATNVRALLDSHHGGLVRGGVVLIASDGWDADPPAELAAALARLRRRAHRVIWLNPRAAAPGYRPAVAALAAALPYCDRMLPAASFADLRAALTALGDAAFSSRASRGWTA